VLKVKSDNFREILEKPMHASFMLSLNSRWSNTTVRLSNYYGTTRPRVILVLLSLSVFSLMGVDRGFAEKTRDELIAMCNADGADQEQKCVAESCQGVCTEEAQRRCAHIGAWRVDGCQKANGLKHEREQVDRKKANGPTPGKIESGSGKTIKPVPVIIHREPEDKSKKK
jgi:hypothetical protein